METGVGDLSESIQDTCFARDCEKFDSVGAP